MAGDTKRDLDTEADEALEAARSLPSGPEKVEALKKAGLLRKAADAEGISFAKREGHGSKDDLPGIKQANSLWNWIAKEAVEARSDVRRRRQ
jgi:hypothetical protein